MPGIFGKMFDFNSDGKLDPGEFASELYLLDMLTDDEENCDNNDLFTFDEFDDDDD
ncbi:MAG: hypothetical protein GX847_04985 [Clostridiales bacterium]|nr:hypothetical protein [Clostridiales bacterium]